MSYLIGTDIGTLTTKSVLVNLEGKLISTSFIEYGVVTQRPGWAEQNPEVWFEAVCKSIFSVLKNSKISSKEVAGICISGLYGGSGVLCDKNMNVLRPCIIWADRRSTEECIEVKEKLNEKEIFKITGNIVDPYYGYLKMLWIKKNEPEMWNKVEHILTPHAFCIYKLTGSISIDYSSAGNYGGLFDINKKYWSKKMMDILEIPMEFFPDQISMSKDIIGEISKDGEILTGLKYGTPISAGGIDAPVSALSAGAIEDGNLSIMLGTSMCNGFINLENKISPKLINYPYVINDKNFIYSFSGLVTAGYCLRWFRDNLFNLENELASRLGVSSYKILDMKAENIPVGSEGLIFLPHMMVGERAPYWDDFVKGCLMGLTIYHTKAHIFRSFLEGIAYALKYSVEEAIKSGMKLKKVYLVDGGARSLLWRRILSDITGLEMSYIAESPGTPLGDALLAGLGTGVIEDYRVIKEWNNLEELMKPKKENTIIYNKYYSIFRKIYEINKDIFKNLK